MFAKQIVLSDAFLDMPIGARCLYMTLGMVADDDGFVNSPRSVMRQCGAVDDDMKILIAKKFVLLFEDGVIVIKHWRINNYLRSDRYQETKYLDHKKRLQVENNGSYHMNDSGIPSTVYPDKDSIDKDSIGKVRLGKDNNKPVKHTYGEYCHVRLTDDERNKLMDEYGEAETTAAIKYLDEYIEMKGYKAKSHYLCIKKWVFDAVNRDKPKSGSQIDWSKV